MEKTAAAYAYDCFFFSPAVNFVAVDCGGGGGTNRVFSSNEYQLSRKQRLNKQPSLTPLTIIRSSQ